LTEVFEDTFMDAQQIDQLRRHPEVLSEIVKEFEEVARDICEAASIPTEYLPDLCLTLDDAVAAHGGEVEGQSEKDFFSEKKPDVKDAEDERQSQKDEKKRDAKDLAAALEHAREEWGQYHPSVQRYVRLHIRRQLLDAGTESVADDRLMQPGGIDRTLELLQRAAEHVAELARRPRGKPDVHRPLKAFIAELRTFWVGILGRKFYDDFYQDYLDDDGTKASWVPKNDASRFVVTAVQRLVDENVSSATCRYLMDRVKRLAEEPSK
jgi:hypothetical protein